MELQRSLRAEHRVNSHILNNGTITIPTRRALQSYNSLGARIRHEQRVNGSRNYTQSLRIALVRTRALAVLSSGAF